MNDTPDPTVGRTPSNPPPLTVAASVTAVEGIVLLILSVLEFASISSDRRELGTSVAVFFAIYGVVLLAAAWGLHRGSGWARGPVLLTQLIVLGLAWNLRDNLAVAGALVVCAGIALAGVMHPDSVAVLDRDPTQDD
ncbi:hypothetical protein ACFQ0K_01980 [Nocardioides caeni]|uniref:Integral membrane protein n=1 Tax=Nocardioides caeni TaxID=574700 RepID=A0A4S8NN76_9ACTN|nr:hypothetical protein [Nocardioides caeni]THV18387.1 hypothetical protein E9934_01785 [Nocardioides caeni]